MAGEEGLGDIEKITRIDAERFMYNWLFYWKSLNFKKGFIEQDEFDQGERIKLNFAHTFGYAIEVITQYAIPHGTAVAIGNRLNIYQVGYQVESWVREAFVTDVDIDRLELKKKLYVLICRSPDMLF